MKMLSGLEERAVIPKLGGRPHIDMRRGHDELLRLCDSLEAIADSLPTNLDQLQCLAAAENLEPLLSACHRFEEANVFPAYFDATGRADTIARLRQEHLEDSAAANELAEVLRGAGSGHSVQNCEALGYMLRAFFGSMRRHVAFERDHVLAALEGQRGTS